MKVLVQGASIAGPVLAYWLTRHGHEVTVVERAPALRKTGGHAIDLFRPAMEISERMGVLPRIQKLATGTTELTVHRPWRSKAVRIDYVKLAAAMSERHVEIMRDDLSEVYYDAARDDVEYLFGDELTSITDTGDVTFRNGAPRRFDVVVGADGLHSGVRRLTFGEVSENFLGGYLAVVSVPKALAREGDMIGYYEPRRVAMVYTADHLDDARAVFLFRPTEPLDYDYRDTPRQKAQLRAAFGGMGDEVDGWLAEADDTPAFYFDAITQLQLSTWSKGRVTLVGDAGYCPGPAVGGSTSLAVYGGRNRARRRRLRGRVRRIRADHDAVGAQRACLRRDDRQDHRAEQSPWRGRARHHRAGDLGVAAECDAGAGPAEPPRRATVRHDAATRRADSRPPLTRR